MGCASSKSIQAVDVYRPAPSSFAVFDITAIEEPWLKSNNNTEDQQPIQEKTSHVPAPILAKLNAIEDSPRTWEEVSKDLEDLKPNLNNNNNNNNNKNTTTILALPAPPDQTAAKSANQSPAIQPKLKRKSFSFHTLEELERKTLNPKPEPAKNELKKTQSTKTNPTQFEIKSGFAPPIPKSLKDNIFILKDREERSKEGKSLGFVKRDPLGDFPQIPPPNGDDKVVVYTTSLGGVRRTYEDCNKVRQLMETHVVAYDERDVSLHGGFLSEMRELLGEGVGVPRVFVKGRYVGGVDEVVDLNERGRLSRILNWAKVERGVGRLGCEGCGGARFVPCLGCGGSCRVVEEGERVRCGECNENGLVHCPMCE